MRQIEQKVPMGQNKILSIYPKIDFFGLKKSYWKNLEPLQYCADGAMYM